MTDNRYLNLYWRAGIALVATFFILFLGQPLHLDVAFTSPRFYSAFAISFSVTMLLMYFIQVVSSRLDRRAPWRNAALRRTALQLFWGVVIPALADICFMALYFAAIGRNMIEVGFFYLDFPFIVLFILAINVLYFGLYLWHMLTSKETELQFIQKHISTNGTNPKAQLTVTYYRGKIDLDVRKDVICFYREDRKEFALATTGERYVIRTPLAALADRYEQFGFCQINPSAIINLATVQGYDPGPTRGSLHVLFKSQYLMAIGSPKDEKFRVTKEKVSPFLSRYEQNIPKA